MSSFSENRQSRYQEIAPLRICVFIFAIFPFLGVKGIDTMLGETVRQAWQIAGAGVLFAELEIQDVVEWDDYILYFAIEQIYLLLVTALKSQFLMGLLITALANILIALLIRRDRINFLYAVSISMVIVAAANALSMLRTGTGGFDKVYFIGGKNALSIMLIPGVFVLYLLQEEAHEKTGSARFLKWLFYGYSVVALGSVIYGKSGTGIVMSLIAFAVIITVDRKFVSKRLMIIGLGVVYGVILMGDSVFSSRLWIDFTTAIAKTPTMTYRTNVWASAERLFMNNPLWGAGKVFTLSFVDDFGIRRGVSEAHNFLLQILCSSGLAGLFLNYKILRNSIGRLDVNDRRHKIVFVCYALILVNGFTEAVNYKFFSILIPALANSYLADIPHQRIVPIQTSGMMKRDEMR